MLCIISWAPFSRLGGGSDSGRGTDTELRSPAAVIIHQPGEHLLGGRAEAHEALGTGLTASDAASGGSPGGSDYGSSQWQRRREVAEAPTATGTLEGGAAEQKMTSSCSRLDSPPRRDSFQTYRRGELQGRAAPEEGTLPPPPSSLPRYRIKTRSRRS